MDGLADGERSPQNWIRRHAMTLFVGLSAIALAVFCKVERADGLTAYVVFLFLLAASAVAHLAGRLARLPEFGWGFLVGGAVSLTWFSFTMVGSQCACYSIDEEAVCLFGTATCLWLIWAYHRHQKRNFWAQLARATGLCWGPLAIGVVSLLLVVGPRDCWDDETLARDVAIALVAPPAAAFVAWIPVGAVRWLWRRLLPQSGRNALTADRTWVRARHFLEWPKTEADARPWQFTVRPLLLIMLSVSIGLGWLRLKQEQAWKARRAIAVLNECGEAHFYPESWSAGPHWLRALLGGETFAPAEVTLMRNATPDAKLALLGDLGSVDLSLIGEFDDRAMRYVEAVPKLLCLTLSHTRVTDAGLVHLRGLAELQELAISDSPITDHGLAHVAPLGNLRSVTLSDNPCITDAATLHLRSALNLRHLDLHNTSVTGRSLGQLYQCEVLYGLDLSGTLVTDESLVDCLPKNLYSLKLDRTRITDAGLANLSRLIPPRTPLSWARLSLADTRITDAGLVHLQRLPLHHLVLAGTRITDAGMAHLGSMGNLQILDLRSTAISDAGLQHFAELPELNRLDLRHTQVTPAGVDRLVKALGHYLYVQVPGDPDDECLAAPFETRL